MSHDGASGGDLVGIVAAEPERDAMATLYRTVFDALDEGFCVIDIVEDEDGVPVDYRFIETNRAFEDLTGILGARGRTILELVPDIERYWIETYGRVAQTGEPARFVAETKTAGTHVWFEEDAFRLGGPASRRVAIHFKDVTARKRVEEELRYRSAQFHTLVEQAPLGVVVLDPDLRVLEVNPAARPTFGEIPALVGRDFGEILRTLWPPAVAAGLVQNFSATLSTGAPYHDPELTGHRADRGKTESYDWRIDRLLLPDGRDGLVCYFRDITVQVAARRAVAASEARYRTLFESIDEGFCIIEVLVDEAQRPTDGRFVEVNPAFEHQTGVANALGRTVRELVPTVAPTWLDTLAGVALTGEPLRRTQRAPALGRWFDVFTFRVGEPHERKVALLFTDVTERLRAEEALRASEAQLRHRAHHDALTGLPNRAVLEDRMAVALAAAERHRRVMAVLFIDLDGFKDVNDRLGHADGDVALAAVARRLQASVRAEDTLVRLHGDEFVVLLPELSSPLDASLVARSLLAAVAEPIEVAGHELVLSASIGIAVYPDDARDVSSLLRAADAAMYRVKLAGRNGANDFGAAARGG